MPTEDLDDELDRARATARDDEALTLLSLADPPATETLTLTERPLPDAVELASDLGAAEVYLFTDRTGDGELGRAGVAFFHNGHVHTVYRESTAWTAQPALPIPDAEANAGAEPADESDDTTDEATDPDEQRKRELADRLLDEYAEYLDENDEYRLRHRLEYMPMPDLLAIRERTRERARADPEEEDRLARIVFRDGRFNRQYDSQDTALLLDALDVDYDPEAVRIEKVHEKAMSLRRFDG